VRIPDNDATRPDHVRELILGRGGRGGPPWLAPAEVWKRAAIKRRDWPLGEATKPMSVRKLPNGKWEARCRDHAGRERAATKRTKAEAYKWERAFLQARDQGTLLDPRGNKTTFKDYAEQWRSMQDHRPKTRRSIRQILTLHAYPTFEARRLSTIRPPEIKTWYAKLPLSTGYKKLCYRWVASIFKAAVQDCYIAVSPCQLSLPTKDKSKPPLEALTVAQVKYAAEHVSPRYAAAIAFAAGAGLRPSEWCGLTVDRVDFLRGVVTVDRQLEGVTKDGHPIFCPPKLAAGYRKVPIAQCIVDALAAHLASYGPGSDGLLFSSAASARSRLPLWASGGTRQSMAIYRNGRRPTTCGTSTRRCSFIGLLDQASATGDGARVGHDHSRHLCRVVAQQRR
jgi:integrase